MRSRKLITYSLLTASTLSFINLANADTAWLPGMPWTPRFTLGGQTGNQKDALLDILLPMAGDNNSLWYLDTRGQLGSYQTNMLSVGAGYRQINNNDYILGGYGFLETYLSPNNQRYYQATVGGEYLSNTWDARVNAYVPIADTKHFIGYTYGAPRDGGYYLRGHKIYLEQYGNTEVGETGGEIELGHSIPFIPGLRAYAGFYHFGVGGQQVNINGPEARLDYQINNNIALTVSEQHDNVRGNLFLIGTRISIGGAPQSTDRSAIANRMEDFVFRNFSMVTHDHIDDNGIFISPENVYYANNAATAGGDGTYEHPYRSAAQASTSANSDGNPNNIVYIYAGNGSIYDNGSQITLQPGQTFIGSGVPFIYRGVTLLSETNNSPILSEQVNVASNTSLGGFNIDGSGTDNNIGIYANGVNNVTINKVSINNISGGLFYTGYSEGCTGQSACGIDIENSSNIILNNININNITGQLGGETPNGANGLDGTTSHPDGTSGGTGENGYNGGNAYGININNSSNVSASNINASHLTGGNGGNAGAGGTGGNGADGIIDSGQTGGNGGTGGTGGIGGTGGAASGINVQSSSQITLSNVTASAITAGDGGLGGYGGFGGNGGNGADIVNSTVAGIGGKGGTGGTGGTGGSGGNASGISIQSSQNVKANNINVASITGGNGGDGGIGDTGGNGGAGGGITIARNHNNLTTAPAPGSGGDGGDGGDGGKGGDGGNGGNAAAVSSTSSSNVSITGVTRQNLQGGTYGNGTGGGTGGAGGQPGFGTPGTIGSDGLSGGTGNPGQNGQVTN